MLIKMKTRIYATPAVKGLKQQTFSLFPIASKCIFIILKFTNYIKFIKNMLFVYSINILKRQNNHLD